MNEKWTHCKYSSILYHFRDIWCCRIEVSHPENLCMVCTFTSFGLQGGYAINQQDSGPGRHGSRGVCLRWLSYPLINRKHCDISRRSAITRAAMQSLENQIWRSLLAIWTKLKLYNTCILPIFLYGSDCWAISKTDARKIDELDQWCLRMLLGIK